MLATAGPRAINALRGADRRHLVRWPAADTAVPLIEAPRIVLLEATAHLLDVQRALHRTPAVPSAALRDTAQLLAELAPAIELIEAATGRSATWPEPLLR